MDSHMPMLGAKLHVSGQLVIQLPHIALPKPVVGLSELWLEPPLPFDPPLPLDPPALDADALKLDAFDVAAFEVDSFDPLPGFCEEPLGFCEELLDFWEELLGFREELPGF